MDELVAVLDELDEPRGVLLTAGEDRASAAPECESSRAPDFTLARQAAAGDLDSFEEIYRRHARRVYGVCLRMTGNAAEAEDLTQNVFVHIFRKLGAFRGESALTTWLHRVAVNQVLMHFRKRRSRPESLTTEGETPAEAERGTGNPNRMPVIDPITLDEAMAQLPPGYRTVFVLRDVEGYEHGEIARMLGMAVGTSKSQLHKARMKLRGLIRRATPPDRRAGGGRGTNAAGAGDAVTKKTILVVEDDDLIRSSIRAALEGEYEVLTAKDGIEGLRRFDRHRAQIQLVITDLMMPRLGGELLVEMVRRTDADLPIIVMTGGAGETDLDKLLARPRVALLRKPFQIEQLIRLMADAAACGT